MISAIEKGLTQFAEEAGITTDQSAPFTLANPLLNVMIDAPAGWVAVRNRIDVVLLAPVDQQIYSARGTGPDAWKLATALRVRRFRNTPPWELSDTIGTLDSLYVLFGERVDERPVSVADLDAVMRIYNRTGTGWNTYVVAAVVDDLTYLFEYGCPTEFTSACEIQLDRIINSVRFPDG